MLSIPELDVNKSLWFRKWNPVPAFDSPDSRFTRTVPEVEPDARVIFSLNFGGLGFADCSLFVSPGTWGLVVDEGERFSVSNGTELRGERGRRVAKLLILSLSLGGGSGIVDQSAAGCCSVEVVLLDDSSL